MEARHRPSPGKVSAASKRLPHFVRVVNNTILTGARRRDGYEGSIRMSSKYGSVLRGKRPIVANNVIALLAKRRHICSAALVFALEPVYGIAVAWWLFDEQPTLRMAAGGALILLAIALSARQKH